MKKTKNIRPRIATKIITASLAVMMVATGATLPVSNVSTKNNMLSVCITADAAGTYNSTNAINYAYKYWSSYNPSYRNYNSVGGDCANFISQILLAGGLKTDKTWYNGSTAWINCAKQRSYLINQGYSVVNNAKASDCKIGDIVYYYKGSSIAHTAIVTKVSGGNVYVTAHNNNHKDYEWTLGGSRYWSGSTRRDIIRMKGTSSSNSDNNNSNNTKASVNWPSLSTSKYMAAYAISNSRSIKVYTDANLKSVDKNRYIYGDLDEIYVYKIGKNSYGNMYAYASYPTTTSGRRKVYIPLSVLTNTTAPVTSRTAKSQITTYKKAGGASYGYVSSNDNILKLGTSGSYTQIIYPITNNKNQITGYKMAFIKTSDYNNKTK